MRAVWLLSVLLAMPGLSCIRLIDSYPESAEGDAGGDADGDSDTDSDSDGDVDGDADGDADGDVTIDAEGCTPDCTDRQCGLDPICDEVCPPGCASSQRCDGAGRCVHNDGRTWVTIPSGGFVMGSPPRELGRSEAHPETEHHVTLTRSFEMLSTEVTRGNFANLMFYDPSNADVSIDRECATDCPVETVSWHEAADYTNELSAAGGLSVCYTCEMVAFVVNCRPSERFETPYDCPGYRLPTEAEWEYAARAGTTTATYNGDLDISDCGISDALTPIAYYCGNSSGRVHPAASLTSNAWGLHDMLGNVREWCHDTAQTDLGSEPVTDPIGAGEAAPRILRGGNALLEAKACRAASRWWMDWSTASDVAGFRVVRTLRP